MKNGSSTGPNFCCGVMAVGCLQPFRMGQTELRQGFPRWLDAVLATAGVVVTLPLLAIAAVAVRASSPGPVLFRQRRVGKAGRQFELIKFRSMRTNDKAFEVTAADDSFITGVGRVLRRTKI